MQMSEEGRGGIKKCFFLMFFKMTKANIRSLEMIPMLPMMLRCVDDAKSTYGRTFRVLRKSETRTGA